MRQIVFAAVLAASIMMPGAVFGATTASTSCGGTRAGNFASIDRKEATCPWAFNATDVVLWCYLPRERAAVVVTDPHGRRYALNDRAARWASATGHHLAPLDLLRRRDPKHPSRFIDLAPWVKAGAALCSASR